MSKASAPPSPVSLVRDLPDWCGAYLVKDLRQAIQNPIFIVAFFLVSIIQLAIVFNLDPSRSSSSLDIDSIITLMAVPAICMLLFQPLRLFFANLMEPPGKFQETIALTGMSGAKVVLSRWLSVNIQNGLLSIIILPYLILAYFSASINPLAIFASLVIVLFLSSFIAALTILSASISLLLIRLLVLLASLGAVWVLVMVPLAMLAARGIFRTNLSDFYLSAVFTFPTLAILTAYSLMMAAGRYLPQVSTYTRTRRVTLAVAVATAATAIVLFLNFSHPRSFIANSTLTCFSLFIAGILALAFIDILTEPVPLLHQSRPRRSPFHFLSCPGPASLPFFSAAIFTLAFVVIILNIDHTFAFPAILLPLAFSSLCQIGWLTLVLPKSISNPEGRLLLAVSLLYVVQTVFSIVFFPGKPGPFILMICPASVTSVFAVGRYGSMEMSPLVLASAIFQFALLCLACWRWNIQKSRGFLATSTPSLLPEPASPPPPAPVSSPPVALPQLPSRPPGPSLTPKRLAPPSPLAPPSSSPAPSPAPSPAAAHLPSPHSPPLLNQPATPDTSPLSPDPDLATTRQQIVQNLIRSTRDFPEFFHAYLVKDFRQSLKNPAFLVAFFLFAAIELLVTFAIDSNRLDRDKIISLLFLPAFVLLVFQPLRILIQAFVEPPGKFEETILLTGMKGGGLMLSRWLSIALQNALLAITILPILVLSYFTVQAPLLPLILSFATLFLCSASYCAICIFTTSWRSLPLPLRVALTLAVIAAGLVSALFFEDILLSRLPLNPRFDTFSLITSSLTALACLLGAYSLMMAAGRYFPQVNPLTRLRRLTLTCTAGIASVACIVIATSPLSYTKTDAGLAMSAFVAILLIAFFDILSEPVPALSRRVKPVSPLRIFSSPGSSSLPLFTLTLALVFILPIAIACPSLRDSILSTRMADSRSLALILITYLFFIGWVSQIIPSRVTSPAIRLIIAICAIACLQIIILVWFQSTAARSLAPLLSPLAPCYPLLDLKNGESYLDCYISTLILFHFIIFCATSWRQRRKLLQSSQIAHSPPPSDDENSPPLPPQPGLQAVTSSN